MKCITIIIAMHMKSATKLTAYQLLFSLYRSHHTMCEFGVTQKTQQLGSGHLHRNSDSDSAAIQWNVSYPNMSGLNPVCNYEYSVCLKVGKAHACILSSTCIHAHSCFELFTCSVLRVQFSIHQGCLRHQCRTTSRNS